MTDVAKILEKADLKMSRQWLYMEVGKAATSVRSTRVRKKAGGA